MALSAIRLWTGSPGCNIGRTFRAEFRWTFYRRQLSKPKTRKAYRNPIALALEWHKAIDLGQYSSKADLARKRGISRARVTQLLNLLGLAPKVLEIIVGLGDPLPSPMVNERQLRQLIGLPRRRQMEELTNTLGRMRHSDGLMPHS